MRPLEEVRAHVLDSVGRLDAERVDFQSALWRVLAETVRAPQDVPHFANSAMDGFAVRAGDVQEAGATLKIVDDVPAGAASDVVLGPGEAIRIMTGAPIPEGADTVVRVEDTSESDDKVTVSTAVDEGTYVRPSGGDVAEGQVVFEPGARLSPMHLGVLATIGYVEPLVSRRPQVAVLSTGDELQPPDTGSLAPGMIRDSNRPMLKAFLQAVGVDVLDMGRVADDEDELRAVLGRAAVEADVIVTSGGVSMGDYDVTKIVLQEEAGIEFISVAMKPGKPFAFGKLGGTPFFGLPGNPVSVMVSFEQFVRPALLRMQGADLVLRPRIRGLAGELFETDPEKTVFVRVELSSASGTPVARQTGSQASNVLSGAANADAFAVVPRGVGDVVPGDEISIELFRALETRGLDHG